MTIAAGIAACAPDDEPRAKCAVAGDCATDQHCRDGACRANGTDEGEVGCDAPETRFRLAYDTEGVDLETGTSYFDAQFDASRPWDVMFFYNGSRTPHGTLYQNQNRGTVIAHTDIALCDVTRADVDDGLAFTTSFVDQAFSRTVVVVTSDDHVFALGDATELTALHEQDFRVVRIE